jgi:hypothetical protein
MIPRFDNYFVEVPGTSGMLETEKLLESVRVSGVWGEAMVADPPGKIKFWECLPDGLKARFIRARFTDMQGGKQLLSELRTYLDHVE